MNLETALTSGKLRVTDFVDALQRNGRYTFTTAEVAAAVGCSGAALLASLRRLKTKRRLISPRQNFYVVIPLEYQLAGSVPADWFIDGLMAFLRKDYYVGLLSAATLHGASHQQPQVFQVVAQEPLRPVLAGRLRIEFHRNRRLASVPCTWVNTPTGRMRISTAEATAVDLVRYPVACGGLSNVCMVLTELAGALDQAGLAAAAQLASTPDVQRLGYLLHQVGLPHLAEALQTPLARRRLRTIPLRADMEPEGPVDETWRVVANDVIELDL